MHAYNKVICTCVNKYRMKRQLWILVLLLPLAVRAQFDVSLTNSWALQSYYNPAAAGLGGLLDVKAVYSNQMMGFEDSPSTMLVTADLPLFFIGPSHGAGIGFMNDEAGMFSTKKIYLQYAYHQKLLGGRLSASVRPVLLVETFDGSKADLIDSNDPAFISSEAKGTAFDLDCGLRYTYKDVWYAGASAMHLLSPTIELGDDKTHELSISPHFYAVGGYKMRFRYPRYALALDGILKSDMQAWRGDITARIMYDGPKHKLYGGLMYSPTVSVGMLVGFDFHGINIGYSYEAYTGGIGALSGTHEIVIGYQTDLSNTKKGKNMHKSVRLL